MSEESECFKLANSVYKDIGKGGAGYKIRAIIYHYKFNSLSDFSKFKKEDFLKSPRLRFAPGKAGKVSLDKLEKYLKERNIFFMPSPLPFRKHRFPKLKCDHCSGLGYFLVK